MKERAYLLFLCMSLIMGLFSIQSCSFEDDYDCSIQNENDSIYVYFTYLPKDIALRGITTSDVKSITFFVFDTNGKFILSKKDDNVVLTKDYYISLKLSPGKYNFVAWGNLNEPYNTVPAQFEPGITDISSSVLYLKRPLSNSITTVIPPLFFANKVDAEVLALKEQKFHLLMGQNTNKINLIAKGLPRNKDIYALTITDSNSKYKFDNSFAPDTEFDYRTTNSLGSNNQLQASLSVLRLTDGREAILELFNETQNKLTYKHDLIDLLNRLQDQHTNIDWVNTHEFEIILTFGANLEIQVTINGWNVVTDDTQLP